MGTVKRKLDNQEYRTIGEFKENNCYHLIHKKNKDDNIYMMKIMDKQSEL